MLVTAKRKVNVIISVLINQGFIWPNFRCLQCRHISPNCSTQPAFAVKGDEQALPDIIDLTFFRPLLQNEMNHLFLPIDYERSLDKCLSLGCLHCKYACNELAMESKYEKDKCNILVCYSRSFSQAAKLLRFLLLSTMKNFIWNTV